jgi:hypothetical protein
MNPFFFLTLLLNFPWIQDTIWFYNESKKFTGYNGLKFHLLFLRAFIIYKHLQKMNER